MFRNEKIRQRKISEVTEKYFDNTKNKETCLNEIVLEYAKRIQKAILPPKELVNDYLF